QRNEGGTMKRNKGLGFVYQPKFKDRKTGGDRTSPTWWISYSHRGKRHRESSNSTNRADAVKLLKKRIAELGAGRPVGPDVDRTTLQQITLILYDDSKKNRWQPLRKLSGRLQHKRDFFGMDRAADITADRIDAYVAHRLDNGAANATANRELAA